MELQITPSAAASRAINAIRQQMQNTLATLENQDIFLRESIEQSESVSANEYNEALDRLEAQYQFTDQQKQEIELLKLEIHSLKEKQADFEHAALDAQSKASKAEIKDIAEEFWNSALPVLLWILAKHQGGKSDIGQPIRKLLGIGQFDDLTKEQFSTAMQYGKQINKPVALAFELPERMHHELEGDRVADSHANAFCDGYNQCLSEVIALVEEAESQNEHA